MNHLKLDNFEGPLDLLLHLVKEENIDICDIDIEKITEKYLEYIQREEDLNINVSSEYLIMASELMYIKSKTLLPQKEKEEEPAEEDLTRENLINKLIEYKKYKELAPTFKSLELKRQNIFIKGPEKYSNYIDTNVKEVSSVDVLVEAFQKFLNRKEEERPLSMAITNKEYSIKDRKNSIKAILQNKKKAYLEDLLEDSTKPYIVVTFLGILELVKEKEVTINQDRNFDRILVELR